MKAYRVRLMCRFPWPWCVTPKTVNSDKSPEEFDNLVQFILAAAQGAPWVGDFLTKAVKFGFYVTVSEIKG